MITLRPACLVGLILFAVSFKSFASSSDSLAVQLPYKKRLALVLGGEGLLYTGSIAALNFLWYENHPRSSFHFFNDNAEWLQMDKAGHAVTSYHIGRLGAGLFRWSGIEGRKAAYFGAALGTVYLGTIEALDAFSSAWGFSGGDFVANMAGSALMLGQELIWKKEKLTCKFSFGPSPYASYRPALLGSSLGENILKDYNGQTYWLSLNIASFIKKTSTFPPWLNLALGYGASGMTGARSNPLFPGIPAFSRYRQYYLSLDVDLTRIKTHSRFIQGLFAVFNIVKIPAPALEYNSLRQVKFRALHF